MHSQSLGSPVIRVFSRKRAEQHCPCDNEVCISISNPRQSPAQLDAFADVLRLGFHDTDRPGGNFTPMTRVQAQDVIDFSQWHRSSQLTVHCEFGASRSVAVGLFLAVWLQRSLLLAEVDVLMPNRWVLRQLRLAAPWRAFKWQDPRLFATALRGPLAGRFGVLPADIAATFHP